MGKDKRFIQFDGQTLLERALGILEAIFSEVLIVVARRAPELDGLGPRVITDAIPDRATLGGLYTGLSHAHYQRIFAVACDMPFLKESVIRHMIELGDGCDVVMANLATGLQPVHAMYSKACLPRMLEMIESRNLKIQELVKSSDLRVRLVGEDEFRRLDRHLASFININTPADLELARKLLHADTHRGGRTI